MPRPLLIFGFLVLTKTLCFGQYWSEQEVLNYNGKTSNAHFGHALDVFNNEMVATTYDQETIVQFDTGIHTFNGLVELFEYHEDSVSWSKKQSFITPLLDGEYMNRNQSFGSIIKIIDNFLFISSPTYSNDNAQNQDDIDGAVIVFHRTTSSDSFTLFQTIKSNKTNEGLFGASIDMDDSTLIIGSPLHTSGSGSSKKLYTGRTSIFVLKDSWELKQVLEFPTIDGLMEARSTEYFGQSVAIDSNLVLIGSPGYGFSDGVVLVYTKNNPDQWVIDHYLEYNDQPHSSAFFGTHISYKYSTLVIRSRGKEKESINIYTRDSGGWNFILRDKFDEVKVPGSKSITQSKDIIAIAIPGLKNKATPDFAASTGGIKFYKNIHGKFVMTQYIRNPVSDVLGPNGSRIEYFGYSLALNEKHFFVGARNNIQSGISTFDQGGRVYYYNPTFCEESWDTLDIEVCQKYKALSGKVYKKDGHFQDTAVLQGGCFRHLDLTLKVVPNSFTTIDTQYCDIFTTPSGKYSTNLSTTVIDTIPSYNGCDSIITINLTTLNPNSTILKTDISLVAEEEGLQYQWLDCSNNFTEIEGATSRTLIPEENGLYAVRVSNDTCETRSDCYYQNGTYPISKAVVLNNNPVHGIAHLKFKYPEKTIRLHLTDQKGKILNKTIVINHSEFHYPMQYASGIYFLNYYVDGAYGGTIKIALFQ